MTLLRRLFRHWHVDPITGCWMYDGSRTKDGYGQISRHGKQTNIRGDRVYVHRLAHELFIGPIPEGLTIDHVNHDRAHRACFNPLHIEAVTNRENILRGASPSAHHARKTCCPKGHPYSSENTRLRRGQRECRICTRVRQRKVA